MRRYALKTLAVVGSAAVVVGAVSTVASAATPQVTGRAEIAYIAPTSGQSVKMHYKDSAGIWGFYCFRWAGGKNTGAIASDATGIEAFDNYLNEWSNPGGLNSPLRSWEIKTALYASGDCSGTALASENVPTRSQSTTQYVVDFR